MDSSLELREGVSLTATRFSVTVFAWWIALKSSSGSVTGARSLTSQLNCFSVVCLCVLQAELGSCSERSTGDELLFFDRAILFRLMKSVDEILFRWKTFLRTCCSRDGLMDYCFFSDFCESSLRGWLSSEQKESVISERLSAGTVSVTPLCNVFWD